MASYVPQSRPGLEFQMALVPGAHLSDSVQENDEDITKLAHMGQLAIHLNPGEWFGEASGITFGTRIVDGGDSHPLVEPMIRYRRYIDPNDRFAVGAVLYGTYNDGEHEGSSFEMTRFGGEVGMDVRVTPASAWFEVHVSYGASATGLWASGKYCRAEDGYARDCDPTAGLLANTHVDMSGVFPSGFVGLSLDLLRGVPVFHGFRLGASAAAGTYPYFGAKEEAGSGAWYGFGFDLSVAFGAK